MQDVYSKARKSGQPVTVATYGRGKARIITMMARRRLLSLGLDPPPDPPRIVVAIRQGGIIELLPDGKLVRRQTNTVIL